MLDPAGSGAQGDSWRFEMHRGFGGKEVATTVEASRYLQENLDYIDADRCGKSTLANELNFRVNKLFSRTAIWGWSYGGFLALSVLGRDDGDVFRYVNDWNF